MSELWEKGDVYAVYLYLIFRYDAEIGGTPQKLVWFSKREDLLKLYLNHFVVAFKELVSGYEDVLDSEEDADDENDDEEGYTAEEDDAAESEETEDADAGLGEGDE